MNKNELTTNIGKFIRRTRRKAYLSQKNLALLTDHSLAYISSIEHGKVSPTIDTLYKICEVLEISVCDLFILNDSDYKQNLEIKLRIEAILETFSDSKKLSFVNIIEDVAEILSRNFDSYSYEKL